MTEITIFLLAFAGIVVGLALFIFLSKLSVKSNKSETIIVRQRRLDSLGNDVQDDSLTVGPSPIIESHPSQSTTNYSTAIETQFHLAHALGPPNDMPPSYEETWTPDIVIEPPQSLSSYYYELEIEGPPPSYSNSIINTHDNYRCGYR